MTTKKEFTRVNDPDDLEVVVPKPVPDHPGFYYFPSDKRLGVNKNSEVLNVKTGKIIKPALSKAGKWYALITSPKEKAKAYLLHRIVAITFIGRPSRHLDKEKSCLEVNHIDGDRSHNFINNLEWVTGEENARHARDNDLSKNHRRVLAKCVVTGNIIQYISVRQCAKDFMISHATLAKHLSSKNVGKLHKDGYIFRYGDKTTWDEEIPGELKTFSDWNEIGEERIATFIYSVTTKDGTNVVFDSIVKMASVLMLPVTTLWRRIKKFGNFEYSGYVFEKLI